MTYDYQAERPAIFTDSGQRMFLSVRDRVKRLLEFGGAFTLEKAISGEVGSNWEMMACVDRLVELGEITELEKTYPKPAQMRVFVKANR